MNLSMLHRRIREAAFVAVVTLLTASTGLAQSLEIKQKVVAGGGATSSGSTFQITGTVGQPAAGTQLSNNPYSQVGGFWYAAISGSNAAPMDISLSQTSVAEHLPSGTTVGLLSTSDPNIGDTFTYALVSGEGSTDNGKFSIASNSLRTASIFDSATDSTYSIRVRSTDQGGLSVERPFVISITTSVTFQFSSGSYTVAENVGVANITVTRSGSAGTFTVNFATSNGSAGPGDYTTVQQTLTFANGQLSQTVGVPINNDLVSEPAETINLTLSDVSDGSPGPTVNAVLTITDDDPSGGMISFGNPGYSVPETGPGFIDITVSRSGDISKPVTIDYATPDHSDVPGERSCLTINTQASSRCDYTTSLGTLRFGAFEAFKTFRILISQDVFVEGPETLQLTLSNPTNGAVLGQHPTATLTIEDDQFEGSDNPIFEASNFVRQHYHDFLNRVPDAPGLAFWTNQILECGEDNACLDDRRANVSAAFFLSIEFQQTGYLIERIYKAAYGDAIEQTTGGGTHDIAVPIVRPGEFLLDTQEIRQNVVVGQTGWETVLENNKRTFVDFFTQRDRFKSAFPTSMTAMQFVDKVNENAGNVLSASERDQLIDDLIAGRKSRAQVLRAVAEDQDLYEAEFNKAFVMMQYFGYLRRNPNRPPDGNYDGYEFWLNKLNQFNGDYKQAEMVKAFTVSLEYRQRFGRF